VLWAVSCASSTRIRFAVPCSSHGGRGLDDVGLATLRVHQVNYGVYGARKVWLALNRGASPWRAAPWSG
jgi:hypothetical protein